MGTKGGREPGPGLGGGAGDTDGAPGAGTEPWALGRAPSVKECRNRTRRAGPRRFSATLKGCPGHDLRGLSLSGGCTGGRAGGCPGTLGRPPPVPAPAEQHCRGVCAIGTSHATACLRSPPGIATSAVRAGGTEDNGVHPASAGEHRCMAGRWPAVAHWRGEPSWLPPAWVGDQPRPSPAPRSTGSREGVKRRQRWRWRHTAHVTPAEPAGG